jgi:TonB family protein
MDYSFWLESLARSTTLLVLSGILLRTVRKMNAAVKHRLLLCILALLGLLPVSIVLLPQLPLSLWTPRSARKELVTVLDVSSKVVETTSRPQRVNWLSVAWMTGALLSFLPLMLGTFKARRVVRRARRLRDEIWISNELCIPMTCGIVRPRIILPADALVWTSSQLQAVLSHERAHVRRHDVAAQAAAHVVACLWWFQPLVWIFRRRLRSESEFAADAEAIRSGVRASEYAAALLAVAKNVGRGWTTPGSAIAMVRSSNLEDRVRAVLYRSNTSLTPAWNCMLGLILVATALAASAVRFRFQDGWNETGGSTMKRTILSAIATSAGLSAATMSGTVHDVKGAAVVDAKVIMSNLDTAATQEAVTGSDGKFSFDGSGAGQYILRIEKPGLTSILRVFDMKAESNMEREFMMPTAGAEGVPDVVTGNWEQESQIRIGGEVAQSNLVRKVQPVYPASAKSAHVQGIVNLEVVISKDGVPAELRVVSSPSDDLSNSALEAVRLWRYRPTLLNGNPVEIVTTVIVNYTLAA